jgi:hypothetical protein
MKISRVSGTAKSAAVSMLLTALLLALTQPAAAKSCDRDCLRGFVTQYLNAMVAHNPVYGGEIHAINAFMRMMPANAGSGWDSQGAGK